ncbi:MAG: ADP-ribosylation factor-like protein [Promethearchaeota archaeon]
MPSSKILSLVNIRSLPSDLQKLLDESITILKGAEEKDFQALEKQGITKIKNLIQIENFEKVEQVINSMTLEKLVTTARIIASTIQSKGEILGKKVIIAGLDAAGKTTIIKTILNPINYKPGDEKPTQGVETNQLELFGFDVNLWDLGGQSLYRSEYLGKGSERHFGFTNLFVFVIDVQAPKRFEEAIDYLKRIIEIYKHLEEEPYCLILIHKSDPDFNQNDIKKRTDEITQKIKKFLVGFPVSFHNTSVHNRTALFLAFSKGIREISMVKEILIGILNTFQRKIKSNYLGLYNKTGICMAETGDIGEFLKNFTINIILGEELNIFPAEASKLILALKDGAFCIIERIEMAKERLYLVCKGRENPDALIHPPLFGEMEPWIINFLD